MSYWSVKGDQSTSTEVTALANLTALATSGAGEAIQKTGATTFANLAIGSGTVTSVSVTTANGVSGSVANATTTPAITLTLGAITPTTVNGLTITANGTNTLTITAGKTLSVSKTMTFTAADDTGVYTLPTGTKTLLATDGSAASLTSFPTLNQNTTGSAATLTTARTIGGVSFDGSANIVPQTIQSINEATDTTCYPLFITAAGTQSLQPLNNSGFIYNSNANSLTATTFIGALTGTASGNLVSGGALGTPSSGTLTNCTSLPIAGLTASTSTAIGVGSVELGHASDTTIARVSAGVASIEGVQILTVAGGTLTGNIVLGENTSIDFDPAGSADGKYSGLAITGTAGEALAFGDVIVLDVTAGKWFKASVSAAAGADGDLRGGTGMCVLAAAGDASATKILLHGTCRADANFPALTVGSVVYATTTGDITVTQPTTTDHIIKVLGFALTADEIMFCPSMDYTTHT